MSARLGVRVPSEVEMKPAFASWQTHAKAVAEVLFEGPQGVPNPQRIDWLIDDIDHFLRTVGGRSKVVFQAALIAVATLGPVMVGRLGAFHTLPLELRLKALERLEKSPGGMAVFAVKTLMCLHWFEHPDSAREVGLPDKSPRRRRSS